MVLEGVIFSKNSRLEVHSNKSDTIKDYALIEYVRKGLHPVVMLLGDASYSYASAHDGSAVASYVSTKDNARDKYILAVTKRESENVIMFLLKSKGFHH